MKELDDTETDIQTSVTYTISSARPTPSKNFTNFIHNFLSNSGDRQTNQTDNITFVVDYMYNVSQKIRLE